MKKLKKDVIVHELLILIAQKSLIDKKGNICDIFYPLGELADHLNKKFNSEYHSEQHLYNQLKKFEKENAISLFRKKTQGESIFIKLLRFHEFSHLLILNKNIKLMIANGALELLKNILKHKKEWVLYLGEGTECYYVAQLLFDKITVPLTIYTNNLAIIHLFLTRNFLPQHVSVFTQTGQIKKATYSMIENPNQDNFMNITFDAIFQSPRYIKDNKMYEVFDYMQENKRNILLNIKGVKIMPLTLFEFLLPDEKIYEYGSIQDYDYLILPPENTNEQIYEQYVHTMSIQSYINYVSYNIYTINK